VCEAHLRRIVPSGATASLDGAQMNTIRTYSVGLGYGSVLAMVISYTDNHSVLWAIIDSLLSWFYVLYHLIFH
jgi:hypothetical protein